MAPWEVSVGSAVLGLVPAAASRVPGDAAARGSGLERASWGRTGAGQGFGDAEGLRADPGTSVVERLARAGCCVQHAPPGCSRILPAAQITARGCSKPRGASGGRLWLSVYQRLARLLSIDRSPRCRHLLPLKDPSA